MIVLAIDTCFNRCAACLYDSVADRVVAEESLDMERGHAEVLAPMVQKIFTKAGNGLDRIAVTTGPGTFTGLRIGLSFARALGLAKNVPVIGLDTLHAIELNNKNQAIAIQAGKSGYAYVLREDRIELLSADGLQFKDSLPDIKALACYAAEQPVPDQMPGPVYIRDADAKPQMAPGVVRAANPEDIQQLAALHAACFPNGWTVADLESMLSIPGTQALVFENESLSGMAIVRVIAGEAEILTICVAPTMRHKGIASKLMKAISALSFNKIFLEVAHTNVAARALYKAQGFAETGLRKAYYSNGDDAVLMSKSASK